MSPQFSVRRFELDPTWLVIKALARVGVLELPARRERPAWPERADAPEAAAQAEPVTDVESALA